MSPSSCASGTALPAPTSPLRPSLAVQPISFLSPCAWPLPSPPSHVNSPQLLASSSSTNHSATLTVPAPRPSSMSSPAPSSASTSNKFFSSPTAAHSKLTCFPIISASTAVLSSQVTCPSSRHLSNWKQMATTRAIVMVQVSTWSIGGLSTLLS